MNLSIKYALPYLLLSSLLIPSFVEAASETDITDIP